ncbi:hypothetical protein JCM24511_05678 [Saitozyma sp. JCM 24511]|nr:hypothetical protein JCM24511_05678 [Saitozyma sp. JCM 24511]
MDDMPSASGDGTLWNPERASKKLERQFQRSKSAMLSRIQRQAFFETRADYLDRGNPPDFTPEEMRSFRQAEDRAQRKEWEDARREWQMEIES